MLRANVLISVFPARNTKIYKIYLFNFVKTPRKFIIAIINLRGVSTKLNKYIVFTMQTYKKLIQNLQILQDYILRILQHFVTKFCNFANFKVLLLTVLLDFMCVAGSKFTLQVVLRKRLKLPIVRM